MYRHPLTSKLHKELDNAILKTHLRSGIVPPVHTFQPSMLSFGWSKRHADTAMQAKSLNLVNNLSRIRRMRMSIVRSSKDMLLV